jgi:hypothetical protein
MGVKLGSYIRKEYRFRVFENRAIRKILLPYKKGITENWKKIHKEDLHNL